MHRPELSRRDLLAQTGAVLSGIAFASAAGDLGYTLGTWQSTHYNEAGKGQVTTGKYVTIWRKQADGSWKVVFDGGNPDSSPQLNTAP